MRIKIKMKFTTKDKITKAKIQIQKKNSFFAYLSLFLKFKENNKISTMGVDCKGNCIYNKEFVDNVTDKDLISIIIHEILHLVFLHLIRKQDRDMNLWNISADLVVNYNLKENGLNLPEGFFMPDCRNEFEFKEITITEIDKKTAEMIYSELKKVAKTRKVSGMGGSGNSNQEDSDKPSLSDNYEFDKHILTDENGKELTEEQIKEIKEDWINKITEASVFSKMKGDIPKGMKRFLEDLHKNKVDWKALLKRYIEKYIPYNFSYNFPHKKSISSGYYIPDYEKELIDIVVAVDLSGSIQEKELTDFMSEVIGMARAFKNKLRVRLLTHEVDVNNDYLVENGNIEKIKKLNLVGGGGTSHISLFDYIKDKCKDCKVAIFLTDGESDIDNINMKEYPFDKIFLISENGNDKQINPKQTKIIKLGD